MCMQRRKNCRWLDIFKNPFNYNKNHSLKKFALHVGKETLKFKISLDKKFTKTWLFNHKMVKWKVRMFLMKLGLVGIRFWLEMPIYNFLIGSWSRSLSSSRKNKRKVISLFSNDITLRCCYYIPHATSQPPGQWTVALLLFYQLVLRNSTRYIYRTTFFTIWLAAGIYPGRRIITYSLNSLLPTFAHKNWYISFLLTFFMKCNGDCNQWLVSVCMCVYICERESMNNVVHTYFAPTRHSQKKIL